MRIQLRELIEEDWKAVHAYASLEKVCRYQPWGPNTEAESKQFVEEVLQDAQAEPQMRFVYAIMLEGNMIGSAELSIKSMQNREGEIGYILHPDFWNKGFATEAAKNVLSIGFRTFGLHRICATCDPNNLASASVLKKIGMQKEGLLREHMRMKSGWRDSLLYSILEHEYVQE